MWPIYERTQSQEYQCHSDYPENISSWRNSRDNSLNAKYIVVLKNVRVKKQFQHLERQALPEACDGLLQAYLQDTEAPHVYLLLDLSQDKNDSLSFEPATSRTKHHASYMKI